MATENKKLVYITHQKIDEALPLQHRSSCKCNQQSLDLW